jgi:CelD/BcsL family acetyltransferase involved in cellulose biosynthesis
VFPPSRSSPVATVLDDPPPGLLELLRHPALSPGWLRAWYAAFAAPDRDPAVLVGPDSGPLQGALFLCRRRVGGMRLLHSTTNGHSQYAAFAAVEGSETTVAAAALGALGATPGWDALRLQGLAEPAAAAWERAAEAAGHAVDTERRFANLILDLSAPPPRPPGADTARRRASRERAMMRSGDVVHETGRDAVALDAFLEAEKRSWKAADGELISDVPAVARFYAGLVTAGEPAVTIRLLRRDGAVIAGLMTVQAAGTLAALKVFYDDVAAKYSPGSFLLRRMCAAAAEDPDISAVDLFSTRPVYAEMANATRSSRDLMIWNRSPRAWTLRRVRGALHAARRTVAGRRE